MQKFITQQEYKYGTAALLRAIDRVESDVVNLKLDHAAFRVEFRSFKEYIETLDIAGQFDRITGIVEKLDQERIATKPTFDRLENGLESLQKSVNLILERLPN